MVINKLITIKEHYLTVLFSKIKYVYYLDQKVPGIHSENSKYSFIHQK